MIHGGAAKGNLADNDGGNLECHGGPAAAGPRRGNTAADWI